MKRQGPRFLLLRVEYGRAEARVIPIRDFPTLADAEAAAAEQLRQPRTVSWTPDRVDGVWRRTDANGQGFVIHRVASP